MESRKTKISIMLLRIHQSNGMETAITLPQRLQTIENLRDEIWKKTGVCWGWGRQCQRLSHRGCKINENESCWVNLFEKGIAHGDVIQLEEDVSQLKNNSTYLHHAAGDGRMKAFD